jgi:hypothetical protein
MENISNWMNRRRATKNLEKIDLIHLASLTSDDWRTVWDKLQIEPILVDNGVLIAEITIDGNPAFPFVTFVGYSSREEVVLALQNHLFLTEEEASNLITCTLSRNEALHRLEERQTLSEGG